MKDPYQPFMAYMVFGGILIFVCGGAHLELFLLMSPYILLGNLAIILFGGVEEKE